MLAHIVFQPDNEVGVIGIVIEERYCQAFERFVEAEVRLRHSGLLIKTTGGNVIQNPLVGVANRAMELMHKFLGRSDPQPTSPGAIKTMGCFLELVSPADHAHNNPEKGSVKTRLHPYLVSPRCIKGRGMGLSPLMKYTLAVGSLEMALRASSAWSLT